VLAMDSFTRWAEMYINMFTSAGNWLISTFSPVRFKLWEALPVWESSTQKDCHKSFQIIRLHYKYSLSVSLNERAVKFPSCSIFRRQDDKVMVTLIYGDGSFQLLHSFIPDIFSFRSLCNSVVIVDMKRENKLHIYGLPFRFILR